MPKKVLIIEDRRENIVFIANNILKPMGYEVITARDGQTGLEKAQADMPDLIITDLKLPKLGGLEMMEQLQEKEIDIPTIVMTFHGTEETAKQALRLGARDYLIKPFTIEEMHEALERCFRVLPRQQLAGSQEDQATTAKMEGELAQVRATLATRERQLEQLGKRLANSVGKAEVAEIAQRAATWEEDFARLNGILAQTKEALTESESRANALEEAVRAQTKQINKYKEDIERMAHEMRNMSESLRVMAQDMQHQGERLDVLLPREQDKPDTAG